MYRRISQQIEFLSKELMTNPENYKSKILELLHNLTNGNASGKEPFCSCLRQAIGHKCIHRSRGTCIGCGYEIYLKSFFFYLGIKIENCKKMEENSKTYFSKHKYRLYNATVLYPLAQELLLCLKQYYKVDISQYKKILTQKGLEDMENSYHEIFIEENQS